MLVVNTASECGFTPQYAGLETLWREYRDKGLVVLGFPSNDFGGQEPGTESEIQAFCSRRFDVTFPLYAKLSPQLPDIAEVATGVIEAGASGLSLVNSLRGLVLDEWTLEPRLARAVGGYSGAALRPVALAAVFSCYEATKGTVPIVGMGGVQSGKHALDLIAAGASAVALGSVLFGDLEAPERVRSELEEEARARGFERPSEARGAAHQPFAA